MWIQVRTIDGQHSHTIDGLSKLTTIEELRQKLVDLFDAPPERQRLFYRGKQLEDEHTLFDYNVGLNTIVQLMVKPVFVDSPSVEQKKDDAPEEEAVKEVEQIESNSELPVENEIGEDEETTYKVGDAIDCKDLFMAAWFPGKVIRVERKTSAYTKVEPPRSEVEKDTLLDDGFIYGIMYDGYEEDKPTKCSIRYIRPRAHCKIPLGDLQVNDVVMVHYNVDDPDKLGHWYDAIITSVCNERKKKELVATLFIGEDMIPIADCNIRRIIEVFKIEKPGTQVNIDENPNHRLPDARVQKYECDVCEDRPVKRCNGCGCKACKLKKDADKLLLCDDCDTAYHIYCLKPPLTEIPEADEWYCPECKLDTSEVVGAGEKLKASKKKSKMASATGNTSRDWGRGMACVGRTKFCNIVPSNHFGPIPGIEVGMCWKFRVQVSEAGVHRPHVSGIAGTGEKGAYSIVLSGGYEDDRDDGHVFTYTGSGGRDLSGNKRTADQSCDQTLTRFNLALARNCNAKLDVKNGATAQDWKKGKPIRVVRNAKAAKHSKYAPEEGNRYDGIYKMEKYWPEMGKSGFLVWRYQLRRDDESPAPWTKAGKKRIEELGFQIVYPEGWQEAQELKAKKAEETKKGKGKGKRKRAEVDSGEETEDENADPNKMKSPPAKKLKAYSMNAEMEKLVNKDTLNAHLWKQAAEHMEEGVTKYLSHVEELFCCICCQDLVYKPITTECKHNICKSCLQRSFKADVFSCSACRTELGKDYPMKTNATLITILNKLFPGYEAGR